ncbi:hypothetical protein CRG98_008667 [Punica granatum]|uniref:Uncharacterized protein n=1 Tax=Punica granatum TaxID=22663 RepID=A0A2I0KR15_PUNGR|nr:hypothetical protein CRG98_008667 [Punica granatum]
MHAPMRRNSGEHRDDNANYWIYGKMTETPKVNETGYANETRTCTDPNVDSRRGSYCALLDRAAWECPPSRGDA